MHPQDIVQLLYEAILKFKIQKKRRFNNIDNKKSELDKIND